MPRRIFSSPVGLAIVEAVVVYVVNKKSFGGICVFGRAMSVEMCVTSTKAIVDNLRFVYLDNLSQKLGCCPSSQPTRPGDVMADLFGSGKFRQVSWKSPITVAVRKILLHTNFEKLKHFCRTRTD